MKANLILESKYLAFCRQNLKEEESIQPLSDLVAEAEKMNLNVYKLFFEAEIKIKQEEIKSAKALIEQALKIEPNFHAALHHKAYCLGRLGKVDLALQLNDFLITSLSNSNEELDKIILAEVYINKAVLCHHKGNENDFYKYSQKIIDLHEKDNNSVLDNTLANAKYNRAMMIRVSDPERALKLIDEALEFAPEKAIFLDRKASILRCLARKDNSKYAVSARIATEKADKAIGHQDSADVRMYIDFLLEEFSEQELVRTFRKIKKEELQINNFLEDTQSFDLKQSFFLVLREWNSYTPAVPRELDPGRGGGYFIWHKGQGVVIDPGYDFLRNFGDSGGRIRDINHIIITHSHNDHTADFESILVLLHKFNKERRDKKTSKKIKLYLSQGAIRKFSGIIPLRGSNYVDELIGLNRGKKTNYQKIRLFDGLNMTVMPAYHDDVITADNSISLGFEFKNQEWERTILLTSDTGIYPKKRDSSGQKVTFPEFKDVYCVEEDNEKAIYNQYSPEFINPDLLVAHIGSIKSYEFRLLRKKPMPRFYPDHLGILGTIMLIDNVDPKLAIISEMGEELRNLREKVASTIFSVLKKRRKKLGASPAPCIYPGDRYFIYSIKDGAPLCHSTCKPEALNSIKFGEFAPKDVKHVYLYRKDTDLDEVNDGINLFHERLMYRRLEHHFQQS